MPDAENLSVRLSAGEPNRLAPLATQAAIDSVRGEAYTQGWLNGVADVLAELERAHAFTTVGAKRTVRRIRSRLEFDRDASDIVQPPAT